MQIKNEQSIMQSLKNIKLLACDFDGVFTDGMVYFNQDGIETVRCSRKDSLGTNMLQTNGIEVIVLSKETNKIVSARCKKMGIECWQGIHGSGDKLASLKSYLESHSLAPEHVCFVGDDVNDLACIEFAGVGVTVADGHEKAKSIAGIILTKNGGDHAVRELCDLILQAKGIEIGI